MNPGSIILKSYVDDRMAYHTHTRLLWADSLKGWLILLVVLGHSLQWTFGDVGIDHNHLWNWIYSFHMSAFMAVSGWLAYRPEGKAKPAGRLILHRAGQLLVPYFCWSVVLLFFSKDSLVSNLLNFVLSPDNYFWFLWVLFFIHLIFTFVKSASNRLHLNLAAAIMATALLLVAVMVVTEFRLFGYQYIAYHFIFFSFGYLIHRYPVLQTRRWAVLLPCAILWLVLAWWWRMHDLPSWMPSFPGMPETLLVYVYRTLTALAAAFFLLNAAPLVLDGNRFPNRHVITLGQWSLGIYTAHLSYLTLLKQTSLLLVLKAGWRSWPDWLFALVLFVSALAISLVVVWLLMRNRYTARVMLGKF